VWMSIRPGKARDSEGMEEHGAPAGTRREAFERRYGVWRLDEKPRSGHTGTGWAVDAAPADSTMKFAFNITCCPTWDLPTAFSRAREMGFAGLEITAKTETIGLSDQIAATGIPVVCITGDIAIGHSHMQIEVGEGRMRVLIDMAHSIGCPRVRLVDPPMPVGRTVPAMEALLVERLRPLADYARDAKVELVMATTRSLRRAHNMWLFLEAMNHPAVGACWDLAGSFAGGDLPAVTVPFLNSRIRHVCAGDARISAEAITPCPFGEGNVPLRVALTRLAGIGYEGFVTLDPGAGDPGVSLPAALAKARSWVPSPL
jgi:sugar phosphate isomerase/epimerase